MKRNMFIILVCFVVGFPFAVHATQPWSTMNNGWLYKNGNKFLAIGTWGIYGYDWPLSTDTPVQQSTFNTQTADFNLIVGQSNRMEPYMDNTNDLAFMVGTNEFGWWYRVTYYGLGNDDIPGYVLDADSLYYSRYEMEALTSSAWAYQTAFNNYTDMIIDNVESNMSGISNYIWYLPDECDTYGPHWCWSPYTLGRIYSRIKVSDAYNAIYADFAAPRRGNRYFWGQYNASHPSPPYDDNEYSQAHFDGSPGGRSYVNYTKYPDNIRDTGEAYQNVANIFGINDYPAFEYDPINAGIAAECLHEGVMRNSNSKPPVWLWFNSGDMDILGINISCQIYTSIIYGCTGILFYADGCSSDQWQMTKTLASELKDFEHFITGTVIDSGGELPGYSDVHYCIRQSSSDGKKYLILTHTAEAPTYVWVDADDIPNFDTDATGWSLYGYDVEIRNEDNDHLKKVAIGDEVSSVETERPDGFSVAVRPNPFNPATTLSYTLTEKADVKLDIYNISGQLVETLVDEPNNAGIHTVQFNGQGLPSGLYFYRITAGQYVESGKMTLMK